MFEGMTVIEIIRLIMPLIVLEFGLKIFCLVKVSKEEVQYLPKWAWVIIILVVSTFGPVAFLIFGRRRDY